MIGQSGSRSAGLGMKVGYPSCQRTIVVRVEAKKLHGALNLPPSSNDKTTGTTRGGGSFPAPRNTRATTSFCESPPVSPLAQCWSSTSASPHLVRLLCFMLLWRRFGFATETPYPIALTAPPITKRTLSELLTSQLFTVHPRKHKAGLFGRNSVGSHQGWMMVHYVQR